MSLILTICIFIIGILLILVGLGFFLRWVGLTPISEKGKNWAVFYDDSGYFSHLQKIKFSEKTFISQDKTYNFKPNESSCFRFKTFWRTNKFYHYNINNPDPLLLKNTGLEVCMDPEVYNKIMENNLIKQLNELNNGFLLFIKRYWWVILIIIAVIIFISSGGQDLFLKSPQVIENSTKVMAVKVK